MERERLESYPIFCLGLPSKDVNMVPSRQTSSTNPHHPNPRPQPHHPHQPHPHIPHHLITTKTHLASPPIPPVAYRDYPTSLHPPNTQQPPTRLHTRSPNLPRTHVNNLTIRSTIAITAKEKIKHSIHLDQTWCLDKRAVGCIAV